MQQITKLEFGNLHVAWIIWIHEQSLVLFLLLSHIERIANLGRCIPEVGQRRINSITRSKLSAQCPPKQMSSALSCITPAHRVLFTLVYLTTSPALRHSGSQFLGAWC
jgi:phosphatidylethanolamine-binding protein (PEBP) family uncharacterized protein